jgi:hypothetical protein
VNTFSSNSANAIRQPHQPQYFPLLEDPLRGAMIANASMKLHLRRLRGDLTGAVKTATVTRLLDVSDSVFRALQWLQGGPGATDDDLEELEQLAMVSRAVPGAAEAVAQ